MNLHSTLFREVLHQGEGEFVPPNPDTLIEHWTLFGWGRDGKGAGGKEGEGRRLRVRENGLAGSSEPAGSCTKRKEKKKRKKREGKRDFFPLVIYHILSVI